MMLNGGSKMCVGTGMSVSLIEASFRDGPKDQTRNLEIPGSMLSHRPGMTVQISLRRRQMPDLAGDLARHRCCPRRAAAAFDVDFHPVDFPAARRPDAVHGRRALNAAGM